MKARLRARTAECRRKENGCCDGELSSRRQIAALIATQRRHLSTPMCCPGPSAARSAMTPRKVYHAGEGFYEMPGSHHRISENASDTEPASLLAVFVVDSKDGPLTTPTRTPGSPK